MRKKIAVLLSGSGVYDGTEIQEAVFSLLAIAQNGGEAHCFAPDVDQHHVINHLTGDEMNEKRNVLIESARIARGEIKSVTEANVDELDGLVIPGGFGTAKNHTKWAFEGPAGAINTDVRNFIAAFYKERKPIAALCMGPTTLAKALEGVGESVKLTVGTTEEASPYDIKGISEGMESTGAVAVMKSISEVEVDEANRIVTAPCYMMEASIVDVHDNAQAAVEELFRMLD
jgi:enhancing lycopene biosynthesis protein 2